VISTINGVYTNYINSLSFNWSNYWWIINRTFILGGIPFTFLTIIDFQRKLKKNVNEAKKLTNTINFIGNTSTHNTHQFVTDLKNESISVNENAFIYAIADGNYIDIHLFENNQIKKVSYRLNLSSLEKQLVSPNLIRCHRSYLVNLKKVNKITGNAQGLKLSFKNLSETVPVSRKYTPGIRDFFKLRK